MKKETPSRKSDFKDFKIDEPKCREIVSPQFDDRVITMMIGDETTPMPTEEAFNRFVDEILKPRYAFERTVEGQRFTRRLKDGK